MRPWIRAVLLGLLAFAAVLGLLALAVVAFAYCYNYGFPGEHVPAAAPIRAQIDEHVQPGASADEVRAYLDSAGIEHGDEVFKTTQFTFSEKYGIPPGAYVLGAIVRGSRGSAVSIYFLFDETMIFRRLVVIEHLPF